MDILKGKEISVIFVETESGTLLFEDLINKNLLTGNVVGYRYQPEWLDILKTIN